jgi:hypothetical protein
VTFAHPIAGILPQHQSQIPLAAIKYAYERYKATWGEGWKDMLNNAMRQRDLLASNPSVQTNAKRKRNFDNTCAKLEVFVSISAATGSNSLLMRTSASNHVR